MSSKVLNRQATNNLSITDQKNKGKRLKGSKKKLIRWEADVNN